MEMEVIRILVNVIDAQFIQSIPLNMKQTTYKDVYHFTQSWKYTIKSGYHIEHMYPDKATREPIFGPDTKVLKNFS